MCFIYLICDQCILFCCVSGRWILLVLKEFLTEKLSQFKCGSVRLFVCGIFSFSSSFFDNKCSCIPWDKLTDFSNTSRTSHPADRGTESSPAISAATLMNSFCCPTLMPHPRCLFGVWDPFQFCTFHPGDEQVEMLPGPSGTLDTWLRGSISQQECKFV